MVSALKVIILRFMFTCLEWMDTIASLFGFKILQVDMEHVLKGMGPEEVSEATSPAVAQPLALILKGFEEDSVTGARSRFTIIKILQDILLKRVAIKKALCDYPDVTQTPITQPLFIIGLPRTGTTLLHQLLAQDPQFRAPMLWELVNPVPPGKPERWRESERYLGCKEKFDLINALRRGVFDKIHPLSADLPEECTFALDRNFLQYHIHLRLAALHEFADYYYSRARHDMVETYNHYKQTLQLITHKGSSKHSLVLKSHLHLLDIEALLEVFPDARLIFSYRKLSCVLASWCSMVHKATSYWGPMDKDYGKRVLRLLLELSNRLAGVMKKYENYSKDQQPFFAFGYDDFIKDPVAMVKKIYANYGLVLTLEAEGRMRACVACNPQNKHGRHEYNLSDYGVNEEDIRAQLGPFLDYFGSQATELI